MASEIKVDTISEKTSANGITIDGVNIKDSAIATAGSVPLTAIDIDGGTDIGAAIVDADLFIIDDGAGGTNRKTTASRLKTYVGGSDPSSADGDSLGTASAEWSDLYLADGGIIYFGNDQDITLTHVPDTGLILGGTTPTLTIGDAGAEDTKIVFDGNAQDYHIGLDDSADDLVIGKGSALGTTAHIICDENGHVTTPLTTAFKVTQTSALSVADGHTLFSTNTTEVKDVNADFSGGTFTAPVDGFYYISASVLYESIGSGDTDTIEDTFTFSNGNEIIARHGKLNNALSSGGYIESAKATISYMDANDTLTCTHSDGGTLAVHANAHASHFEGFLLG